MLLCLHSIIHCKFYTLTNQSLLLWHKYLEFLGKNNVFTHVFFAVCHEGWTHKRTIAQQSRRSSKLCESCQPAVTILGQWHPWLQPSEMSRSIWDFSAHFIPASLQIGQRIFHQHGHRSCNQHNTRQKHVPPFLHILKKQQTKYSNVFPVTVYQQAPKLHPKCAYKETYHVLIKRDNKPSPDYLATFKTHTTTCQK